MKRHSALGLAILLALGTNGITAYAATTTSAVERGQLTVHEGEKMEKVQEEPVIYVFKGAATEENHEFVLESNGGLIEVDMKDYDMGVYSEITINGGKRHPAFGGGILAQQSGVVYLHGQGNQTLTVTTNNVTAEGTSGQKDVAIAGGQGLVRIDKVKDVLLDVHNVNFSDTDKQSVDVYGIYTDNDARIGDDTAVSSGADGVVTIEAAGTTRMQVSVKDNGKSTANAKGILALTNPDAAGRANVYVHSGENLLYVWSNSNKAASHTYGIHGDGEKSYIELKAMKGNNVIDVKGLESNKSATGIQVDNDAVVYLEALGMNSIKANEYGIYQSGGTDGIRVTLKGGQNMIQGTNEDRFSVGIQNGGAGEVQVVAGPMGGSAVEYGNYISGSTYGINGLYKSITTVRSSGYNVIKATSPDDMMSEWGYAISPSALHSLDGTIEVQGSKGNRIEGKNGIESWGSSETTIIGGAEDNQILYQDIGIDANGSATVKISSVDGSNRIYGTVAEGVKGIGLQVQGNANLTLEALEGDNVLHGIKTAVLLDGGTMRVEGRRNEIVSGLLGEEQTAIGIEAKNASQGTIVGEENRVQGSIAVLGQGTALTIEGGSNRLNRTISDEDTLLAGLYVEEQGLIQVRAKEEGGNRIWISDKRTDQTSAAMGIWAKDGTITIEGKTLIGYDQVDRATRPIAIAAGMDKGDTSGLAMVNGVFQDGSYILGQVVAGQNGTVVLQGETTKDRWAISGDIEAGNGGLVQLDLGAGSTLVGRADAYMDKTDGQRQYHEELYHPDLSESITSEGTIQITLGEQAKWEVTGQSWITELQMKNGATIAFSKEVAGTETAHALSIKHLEGPTGPDGRGSISMHLSETNHNLSDMLYVKDGTGTYDIHVIGTIDGIESLTDKGLRFATVGGDMKLGSVQSIEGGAYTITYKTDTSQSFYDQEGMEENESYNGLDLTVNKPGEKGVEEFFDINNRDKGNLTNWRITGIEEKELSPEGQTVIHMAQANYTNAVYLDRLNKRLGEARYLDDQDGLWVRIRHDRVGKANEFRSKNTLYNIGYDRAKETNHGQYRIGGALDYMDGSTYYPAVQGEGQEERFGLWLYRTWLGKKGHYTDYVVKWGRLNSQFDYRTRQLNQPIHGDYEAPLLSASMEYGRKKELSHHWYIEPQLQVQYTHVGDRSYQVEQNYRLQTQVEVDSLHSLLGRIGVRIGKTIGSSTFYIKGDVIHEFLGTQTVQFQDQTTMEIPAEERYENRGTWYAVGIGLSWNLSPTQYVYFDAERYTGNGLEETYQINGGVTWKF